MNVPMYCPSYCPVHETSSGFCSADCPDRVGWKDLATLVANVRGMPELVVRMVERIEELAAGRHDLAARVDLLLDEQVAIETRLVDAGIESPDSLTPAGTDVPNRILGMVEDLVAELGEAKNTIKGLRIKNACLLDNADREHGYAIARVRDEHNGTKHALRIYEETAQKLGANVDHLEKRLAAARRELGLTRKAAARRKGALRRLGGAYKAIVRLYLEKCREVGSVLRERDAYLATLREERDVFERLLAEHATHLVRRSDGKRLFHGIHSEEEIGATGGTWVFGSTTLAEQRATDAEARINGKLHRRAQEAESRVVTVERDNVVLRARLDGALRALEMERQETIVWACDQLRDAVLAASRHDGERTADERVRAVLDVARDFKPLPRPKAPPEAQATFAPELKSGDRVRYRYRHDPKERTGTVIGFAVPDVVAIEPDDDSCCEDLVPVADIIARIAREKAEVPS